MIISLLALQQLININKEQIKQKQQSQQGLLQNHNFEYQHDLGGKSFKTEEQYLNLHKQQKNEKNLQQYLKESQEIKQWELKADSIVILCAKKGLSSVDQLRVGIENLAGYADMSYYQRWLLSIIKILTDTQVFKRKELEDILNVNSEIYSSSQQKQLFQVGDIVQVKNKQSNIPFRRPHLRTPGYIYGVEGVVIRENGKFENPELLAFKESGPEQYLYTIRFRQKDVWPGYQGQNNDTIEMEIYQHWLEPGNNCELKKILDDYNELTIPDKLYEDEKTKIHGHSHLPRPIVEQNAVIKEGPPNPGEQICEALAQLLIQKGIFTEAELQKEVSNIEGVGQKYEGARIVAKAWIDPEFKKQLFQDANKAISQAFPDISTSNANPTKLVVVENTEKVHNIVVCTLCSCYPRSILGLPPAWYKSRDYRSRTVIEPRQVLSEFGVKLENQVQIRVQDSTADLRYLVLPKRPSYTQGWDEQKLIEIISRDSMIGVAVL